jgi:hypothetical protein
VPVREVPRDVHGERARSDDQEDRGTDDRGGALHDRSIVQWMPSHSTRARAAARDAPGRAPFLVVVFRP